MIDTSGFLPALEYTKYVFGRASAPDPAGESYSQGRIQNYGLGGVKGWGLVPSPSRPLPSPSSPSHSRPLPLEVCPLNPARSREAM